MTIRCYDGFCMVSGRTDGEEEVCGCVDRHRACAYFINKLGVLTERYFDDAHRLMRQVRPIAAAPTNSLEARFGQSKPTLPTMLLAAEKLIFVGYSTGEVATVHPTSFKADEKTKRHAKGVTCGAAFEDYVYTSDEAGTVFRWDGTSGDYVDYYPSTYFAGLSSVRCMAAHHGVLAVGGGGGVMCMDLVDRPMERLLAHTFETEDVATAVAFTPTALWIGDDHGVVRLVDLSTGLMIRRLGDLHSRHILQLVHVGNTVWSSSTDRVLAVSDATTGTLVERKRTEDESSVVVVLPIAETCNLNVWVTTTSGAMSMWKGTLPVHSHDTAAPQTPVVSPASSALAGVSFDEVTKRLADKDLSYLVPSHTRMLMRLAAQSAKASSPSHAAAGGGGSFKMSAELSKYREVQAKLTRDNEILQTRVRSLEMEVEMVKNREMRQSKESADRIDVLEETQARNIDLLRKREERIEELQKMLAIAQGPATTPPARSPSREHKSVPRSSDRAADESPARTESDTPDAHLLNPPQPVAVPPLETPGLTPQSPQRLSSRNESFLVATRKPLITKLLSMRGTFDKTFTALDGVERQVRRALPRDEDSVRGYMVSNSLTELSGVLTSVQREWDNLCEEFLLAREKEAYRSGAWRSGQPIVPPGTAGSRGRVRGPSDAASARPSLGRASSRPSERGGGTTPRSHSAGAVQRARYRNVDPMPVLHNAREGQPRQSRASRALTPPPCARPEASLTRGLRPMGVRRVERPGANGAKGFQRSDTGPRKTPQGRRGPTKEAPQEKNNGNGNDVPEFSIAITPAS